MKLKELLKVCNAQEIDELYTFWNGEDVRPSSRDVNHALFEHMTDGLQVRRRLRFLSAKLVDLLRFFLGRRQFEASLDQVRRSQSFAFMSPHEVEAAVRALVKRGFLFPCRRTTAHPNQFTVPHELGDLLRGELQDLDLEVTDAFSLRRALDAQSSNGTRPRSNGLDSLLQREAVQKRAGALPGLAADVYRRTLESGGGLLSRSILLRQQETDEFPRLFIKESLEQAHLGTVRHLALGEYGVNHFDDMIILFEEVLRVELEARDQSPSAAGLSVRSLGVDLLSDLSQFLGRLARDKVRLTQSGTVYRTAARKIETDLILGTKGGFDPEELFQFLFDVSLSRHLVRRTSDRYLVLTSKGRTWPRLSVSFKLKELLAAVLDDPSVHFHRPRLQELSLTVLRTLSMDRWYDFALVAGMVRHRYLATVDESGIREAYQSRYQYSSEAHMRDLPQLMQMIASFLSHDLHLLGLIDIARDGERPVKLRLSPLAAKVLEVEEAAEAAPSGPRLVVNPDFEVLLFPEGDSYDLVQRLDRFAERVSTEGAFRFAITSRSVERAVAAGMTTAEILETLSEHSDTELPQNVVYSIRDYAEKVRFVRVQRAFLISARHKEVIDQILKHSDVRRAVLDRISPRLLALHPDADLDAILPMLEKDGVFLESDVGTTADDGPDGMDPGPDRESDAGTDDDARRDEREDAQEPGATERADFESNGNEDDDERRGGGDS